ncbi:hypothetical protein Tco_0685439, partial [Tanacetum coccineum]
NSIIVLIIPLRVNVIRKTNPRWAKRLSTSVKDIINDEVKTQLPQILPKIEKSQSNLTANEHKELYKALVNSYNIDKDLFLVYGKAVSLKRGREDKDKDKDPPAGSDQGMKRWKTSKDAKSTKGLKSKESKSTSSSIVTTRSQPKSSGKSAQAEELIHIYDWFKKPKRPSTPDSDWNVGKSVDFRPPQTWISKIAQAKKPHLSFDELMSIPIDFLAYVINHLKIDNLTQDHLVGPVFNLLKGTCKSHVELEYNIEECYKAICCLGISHWGPKRQPFYRFASNRVSKHDVYSTKRIIAVTKVKVMKWYDYDYLEEIEVQRQDYQLYKFKEGDFPRLHLHDIEDMLLLLVRKKLYKLERDVIFDLGVALRMFTRRIVILKRVEDFQLGVESYQNKLNITKPKTFRSDISNIIPYTTYNNPQGIIYEDKYKRNRLMRMD